MGESKLTEMKIAICLLVLFACLCHAQAQSVVIRTRSTSCRPGTFADYSKSYKRCCYYGHRRLQSVRVLVCRRKTFLWCRIGEHSNYSKSYARCCKYANRRRRTQSMAPRVRVKICQRA